MLRWIVLLVLALAATPAMAQYASSDYKLERQDEDYSYLANVSHETDFFDPIKYIPLNDNDFYLSLGGQARYRFDYFNNSSFGAGTQDETGFDLFRMLVHADAHLGPNLRFFLQIDGSLEYDRAGGTRYADVDNGDFQQAFADVNFPIGDDRNIMLRLGRQELAYGAQRLISPSDWTNTRRSFDGARLSVSLPNDVLDAFVTRPVIVDPNRLNSDDDNTLFAGVYNVMSLGDLIPSASAKLDTYLLALDRDRSSTDPVDSDTFTAGTRLHANPGPFDLDVEADGQFGRYGGSSIAAYSIAAEAGYTFAGSAFAPRLSLGFDLASGSPNPAHRFNQLFPPTYTYLGHLYLFGRENIIDLHPSLSINLTHDLTLTLTEHAFWRQNVNDSIYNLENQVVRPSSGSHQAFIGTEFDMSAGWQVDRHMSAYVGWAHLFTGAFINDTGAHSDPDFFYTMLTYTF